MRRPRPAARPTRAYAERFSQSLLDFVSAERSARQVLIACLVTSYSAYAICLIFVLFEPHENAFLSVANQISTAFQTLPALLSVLVTFASVNSELARIPYLFALRVARNGARAELDQVEVDRALRTVVSLQLRWRFLGFPPTYSVLSTFVALLGTVFGIAARFHGASAFDT